MTATPIHSLNTNINGNSFYVKRDDLIPFSFGGNKARKAINFFREIEKGNYDAVVTYGSSSSNHCRIIANAAASRGIRCIIISPEENYNETANSKLIAMFGAEIIKTPLEAVSTTIDLTLKKLSENSNPYFIPGGGHGNLGTQAYVDTYKEICEFEKENNICFDYIFHASGTGTTQAGLVAGKIMAGDTFRNIVGISIARKLPRGKDVVVDSVHEYLADGKDHSSNVIFTDRYICGGYGKYDDDIKNTIHTVLLKDGMALNSTYTGKAFSGMLKYIKDNQIENKKILFINTGGTPLFFDDLEDLT